MGKITFLTAIMCDDMRQEADGGLSLMGVTDPHIEFSQFPVRQRMALCLLIDFKEPGESTFTAILKWKGEQKWEVESTLRADEPVKGLLVPLGGPLGEFDEPGSLMLTIRTEAEEFDLQEWKILQLH